KRNDRQRDVHRGPARHRRPWSLLGGEACAGGGQRSPRARGAGLGHPRGHRGARRCRHADLHQGQALLRCFLTVRRSRAPALAVLSDAGEAREPAGRRGPGDPPRGDDGRSKDSLSGRRRCQTSGCGSPPDERRGLRRDRASHERRRILGNDAAQLRVRLVMFPGDAPTSRPAPSSSARWALVALAVGLVGAPGSLATPAAPATQTSGTPLASPSPPAVVAEIQAAVEGARQRFEARDAGGVLACVSDQYRSGGLTKAAVREQLLAIFAVYQELRARVTVDQVQTVDGSTWLYTTGDIS